MNFFNRAIKNVTRKIPKSVLLVLTFFLIGNLVIVGLGISNASAQAKTLTRKKMRAVVTVQVDYDKVWRYVDSLEDEDEINKFYENYPNVTLNDVNELLKDERVKTANATQFTTLYNNSDKTLEFVRLNNRAEENLNNSNGQECYIGPDGTQECYSYEEPILGMKVNFFPSMIELEEGDYSIVKGRFYSQEDIDKANDVVVITEELAEVNNLGIGDTIKVQFNSSTDNYYTRIGLTADDMAMELEVIGIYSHTSHITPDSQQYEYTYPYENPDNMMLCPGTTYIKGMLKMSQKSFEYYREIYPDEEYYQNPNNYPTMENMSQSLDTTTLLLSDPLDVDKFIEDYKDDMGEFIKVDANNEEFNRLAKPLDTLSLYANFIVYLVVINAIVIITLVTALTLKTREYEIGVLLSIGASKLKVVMQFFVELALVAIIGFTLAVGSGSIIANKVGETVLNYQIESSGVNEDDDYYYDYDYISPWDNDYSTKVTLDDLVSEYSVNVSPLIIGEIYVVGLGIVLISVIIPSIMIMRFNPKKILMNQN